MASRAGSKTYFRNRVRGAASSLSFPRDGSLFTAEYLAQFDGFMFYTSGELTAVGRDGNPPMTPAGKAAFLDAIHKGKGFVGGALGRGHVSHR
jgi:hypothetical protein